MPQLDLSFPFAPASFGSDHDWELYAASRKILHPKLKPGADFKPHTQNLHNLKTTIIRLLAGRDFHQPFLLCILVHNFYFIYPACVESIFQENPRPTDDEFLDRIQAHHKLLEVSRSLKHPQSAPLPIGRSGREICRWCYEGSPSVVADHDTSWTQYPYLRPHRRRQRIPKATLPTSYAVATLPTMINPPSQVFLSTSATNHAFCSNTSFVGPTLAPPSVTYLVASDGRQVAVEGIGKVRILTAEHGLTSRITLSACYYAPALDLNVISISQLLSKGAVGHWIRSGVMEVWDKERVVFRARRQGGTYVVGGSIQPGSEP